MHCSCHSLLKRQHSLPLLFFKLRRERKSEFQPCQLSHSQRNKECMLSPVVTFSKRQGMHVATCCHILNETRNACCYLFSHSQWHSPPPPVWCEQSKYFPFWQIFLFFPCWGKGNSPPRAQPTHWNTLSYRGGGGMAPSMTFFLPAKLSHI